MPHPHRGASPLGPGLRESQMDSGCWRLIAPQGPLQGFFLGSPATAASCPGGVTARLSCPMEPWHSSCCPEEALAQLSSSPGDPSAALSAPRWALAKLPVFWESPGGASSALGSPGTVPSALGSPGPALCPWRSPGKLPLPWGSTGTASSTLKEPKPSCLSPQGVSWHSLLCPWGSPGTSARAPWSPGTALYTAGRHQRGSLSSWESPGTVPPPLGAPAAGLPSILPSHCGSQQCVRDFHH